MLETYKATKDLWSTSAEIFRTQSIEAKSQGNEILAQLFDDLYNSAANISNLYYQLSEMLAAGYSEEVAKERIDYYDRLNKHFAVKQEKWLMKTHFSPTTIAILTRPIQAQAG